MRRGVTLIELMIAITIGLFLAGVCQDLLARANRLFELTRRRVESTTDRRALVETLARDVAALQQVLAATDTELELFRAADASVDRRLEKNASWAFPFAAGATTTQRQPGLRVRYAFKAKEVTRTEEPGELVARTDGHLATLAAFTFEAQAAATSRVLARDLASVRFRLLGPDPRSGVLRSVLPPEPVRAPLALYHAAVVVLEAGPLMVPFWSPKRRSDAVYPESFSSTDEDLSW